MAVAPPADKPLEKGLPGPGLLSAMVVGRKATAAGRGAAPMGSDWVESIKLARRLLQAAGSVENAVAIFKADEGLRRDNIGTHRVAGTRTQNQLIKVEWAL